MIDLSIVIPALRPNYWKRVYETVKEACRKHSFEIIFISPHNLIGELVGKPEIKHIISYGSPPRCAQVGALNAEGRLLCHTTDDGEYFPDSLDAAIDLWDSMQNEKSLVALRYREGRDMQGIVLPPNYFTFGIHNDIKDLSIPGHFVASCQPLLSTNYFHYLGGIDCRFEHLAMSMLDLCARVQFDLGPAALSPLEVMNANWMPGHEGDHGPVNDACLQNDSPLFRGIYKHGKQPIQLDYNNWKLAPVVWPRRWPNGLNG